jgi:hypothetical protein
MAHRFALPAGDVVQVDAVDLGIGVAKAGRGGRLEVRRRRLVVVAATYQQAGE